MKIWLIAEGEPLPIEGASRLMRVGMLAEYLAKKGHDVTWWSSTFIHGKKDYIAHDYKELQVREHEKLILLHSPIAYKKNTSIKRVAYMYILGHEFRRHAEHMEHPDIICASWPLPPFGEQAVRYGKKHHVPVVLDARDMWPDIFTRAIPAPLKPLSSLLLWPMEHAAKKAFSGADAITGVVPSICQWGLAKAGRPANSYDRAIYIGYDDSQRIPQDKMEQQLQQWNRLGVSKNTFNITFFGSMSMAVMDPVTAIKGIKLLADKYPDMRLILCGDGDGQARNKELAKGIPQVVLPGWCNNAQIQSLLSISNVGLYCLRNLFDFRDTISNKFIGYAAAGLPILSELQGFSKQYIEEYNMGMTYQENNPSSFAKIVEWLYMHPDQAKEMGRNARKRFELDFSSEVVNGSFLSLFQQIVTDYH